MKTLTLAFVLFASSVHAQTITIWTHTDTFTSQDQKNRERFVATVQQYLAKKHLVVSADIGVEVQGINRTEEADGLAALSNALSGFQRSNERQFVTWRLATLTVGDYSTELRAKDALGLAKAVERWVKLNKATLDAQ